ncbi:MAG: hypothetical protein IT494_00150 [Gammaproteobacteria bacterium]|nr:hypothetical protein [Gammaproteobacteria bacterium]
MTARCGAPWLGWDRDVLPELGFPRADGARAKQAERNPERGPGKRGDEPRLFSARRIMLALWVAGTAAPAVSASDLGRLFLHPEQRAALQQQRQAARAGASEPAQAPAKVSEIAAPEPSPVAVEGVVQRRGGRGTVWINGTNDYDGDPARLPETVRVLPGGRVGIGVNGARREIELRPGQVYDPVQEIVRDRFEVPDAAR